jgi:hypothetical protein
VEKDGRVVIEDGKALCCILPGVSTPQGDRPTSVAESDDACEGCRDLTLPGEEWRASRADRRFESAPAVRSASIFPAYLGVSVNLTIFAAPAFAGRYFQQAAPLGHPPALPFVPLRI